MRFSQEKDRERMEVRVPDWLSKSRLCRLNAVSDAVLRNPAINAVTAFRLLDPVRSGLAKPGLCGVPR